MGAGNVYKLGMIGIIINLVTKSDHHEGTSQITVCVRLLRCGFYALLSTAMACFYGYVLLVGGNGPPKKRFCIGSTFLSAV
ncbi:unnamed protein product [Urochloa humidicola]